MSDTPRSLAAWTEFVAEHEGPGLREAAAEELERQGVFDAAFLADAVLWEVARAQLAA